MVGELRKPRDAGDHSRAHTNGDVETDIRLVVAGSRTIYDYARFRDWMDQLVNRTLHECGISKDALIVVTGMASGGPDDMAYHYARWDRQLRWEEHPANWERHGKSAGFIRNTAMAKASDRALVIYDGHSSGTKHMLEQCAKHVPMTVLYVIKSEEQPFIGEFFELKDRL